MLNAPIRDWLLPYASHLAPRDVTDINLVVIHCTELPDLATARAYGERILYADGTGNSGHYYIDRDGAISRFVPVTRVAHHVRGMNPRSIGIELVNLGRYPLWLDSHHQDPTDPYPEVQTESLLTLLGLLQAELPSLKHIAGHEDLDTARVPASDNPDLTVRRKLDPGPLFPWQRVLHASGLIRRHAAAPPAFR